MAGYEFGRDQISLAERGLDLAAFEIATHSLALALSAQRPRSHTPHSARATAPRRRRARRPRRRAPWLFTTNFGHHNGWAYDLNPDELFAQLRARGLNEAQINSVLIESEARIATAYPLAWLANYVWRTAQLFSLEPADELRKVLWTRALNCGPDGPLIARFYRATYAQYYATYVLCGLGALLLVVQRRPMGGLWALALAYILIHGAVSRGDVRLIAPLYPILCVFAASLWCSLRQEIRERQEHRRRHRKPGVPG